MYIEYLQSWWKRGPECLHLFVALLAANCHCSYRRQSLRYSESMDFAFLLATPPWLLIAISVYITKYLGGDLQNSGRCPLSPFIFRLVVPLLPFSIKVSRNLHVSLHVLCLQTNSRHSK